jgi:AI-2 transport protein TqsA
VRSLRINVNAATRSGINALLLVGAVVTLYLGHAIFIPLIIALLLAAMLYPAAIWLHRKMKFSWTISSLTVIAGLIFIFTLVGMGLVVAIPKILKVLPRSPTADSATDQTQQVYSLLRTRLQPLFPLDDKLFPEKAENSQPFAYVTDTVTKYVPEALLRIGYYGMAWLWQFVLILFILLFLLLEGRLLIKRVEEIFGPSPETRAGVGKALLDMAIQIRTYLVWRTLLNFSFAALVGIVYRWAGLSQPWTWAMFTAVLFYIPYLGPIIAGFPPVVDAFLSIESPMGALGIFIFYLVLTVLEGYVVVPVVMGRSMEMNATTVLLACLFWELVWGTVGLFLAMPLMAAIKTICYHVPGWRPWANLMGTTADDPEPPAPIEMPPALPTGDGDTAMPLEKASQPVAAEAKEVKNA